MVPIWQLPRAVPRSIRNWQYVCPTFKKLGHGGREARESDVNNTIVVQTQNVSTKLSESETGSSTSFSSSCGTVTLAVCRRNKVFTVTKA